MDISFILTGVIIVLIAYLITKYFIRTHDYWQKRGIPMVPGALPFFGHTLSIYWSYKTFVSFCDDIYNTNKHRSMIGFFQLTEPTLMILDPELVKTVLISDFSKFHENVMNVDSKLDPLLAQNPFFTDGEAWKTQRNRLSFALMSSKRLRTLCPFVANVCDKFTKYLVDNVERSKNGVYEVEMKKLGNLFTGEVVASAGFGVEGDFFINGTGSNSFRQAVQGFLEPHAVFDAIAQNFPAINSLLGMSFLPKRIDNFFRRVVHEMIVLRKKDGIARNDFLQLMLDIRKKDHGEIDEESITASATSFFFDAYETSAIALAFFVYQLAENPVIQEKLRHEVKIIFEKYNNEINYESLGEMTCMDQALDESMRLYPALGFIVKKCNQHCKLVGNDGLECLVEPGTEILIPLHALHRDSKYWENPEIYDPTRFSEEGKKKRRKMVFLPFGEGPRICVGMRFATMQIKAAIATLLCNFVIDVSTKTKRPLAYKRSVLLTAIEGGLWINLKPI